MKSDSDSSSYFDESQDYYLEVGFYGYYQTKAKRGYAASSIRRAESMDKEKM